MSETKFGSGHISIKILFFAHYWGQIRIVLDNGGGENVEIKASCRNFLFLSKNRQNVLHFMKNIKTEGNFDIFQFWHIFVEK